MGADLHARDEGNQLGGTGATPAQIVL
jgi:hypothetical protein